LISTIVVKCHHRLPFKNQLLISRIDFLLVEIPISHIRNTIISSKNLYFWYQEFNCYSL